MLAKVNTGETMNKYLVNKYTIHATITGARSNARKKMVDVSQHHMLAYSGKCFMGLALVKCKWAYDYETLVRHA